MTFPLVGGTYRLSAATLRRSKITLDMLNHPEARLIECVTFWSHTAILDRELGGSKVWPLRDLAFIPKRKLEPLEVEELPTRFRKGMLPAQRIDIAKGGTGSNLDFGFTPTQARALDAFETAVNDNEHPCIGGDRRRQLRRAVRDTYQELVKLQLVGSLTPREKQAVNFCFGSEVISEIFAKL